MAKYALMMVAAAFLLNGCASTGESHDPYKMECLAYVDFEGCGKVYDTRYECQAAVQKMIRGKWTARERGNCLDHSG